MNFKHLEYVAQVARCGSITQAAQRLLVSQPYLSGMIRDLEQELGFRIFQRDHRGVALTPEGERLMGSVRVILEELERIQSIAGERREEPMVIATYYAPYVMQVFLRFKGEYPIQLPDRIREMGTREVFLSLAQGESRLGLVTYAAEKREKYQAMAREHHCQCTDIFPPFPLCAMMGKGHPLAGREAVSLEDLLQYAYVAYEDEPSIAFLELLRLKEHPNLLCVADRAALFDAVNNGGYLTAGALVPWARDTGCVYVPLKNSSQSIAFAYVIRQGYKLGTREKAFLNYLKQGVDPA